MPSKPRFVPIEASVTMDAVGKIKIATSSPAGGMSGVSYAACASSREFRDGKRVRATSAPGPNHQATHLKSAMTMAMLSGAPDPLVFLGGESRAGLSAGGRNIPTLASVSQLTHHITDSLGNIVLLAQHLHITLAPFTDP